MRFTRSLASVTIALVVFGLFVAKGIQAQTASDAGTTSTASTPQAPHVNAGAVDLNFEPGGVFNGPTLVACDVSSSIVCTSSGKTHIAGKAGATYWMTPSLGLNFDFVMMDGGKISGVTENAYTAHVGIQFQNSHGTVRPFLELAPGYYGSFLSGDTSGFVSSGNESGAAVKMGGGVRIQAWKNSGLKCSVDALPVFSSGVHQTPVIMTLGWFWQSKGRAKKD